MKIISDWTGSGVAYTTVQFSNEVVTLCDISSPMQASACQRSVQGMTLCNRRLWV